MILNLITKKLDNLDTEYLNTLCFFILRTFDTENLE
mgnify:CR=1 FL=1